MRLFLWLLTLCAAAIGLAVTARFNPGNVVLFYPPYRVDMSLNFFLVLAVLTFIVVTIILGAIRSTKEMPGKVAQYRREKREREGNRALRDALKALFEGRFGHAEKAARRAVDSPENAGLAALIGARAANRMQQSDRRDAWLETVKAEAPLKTARLMTQIELLIDQNQPSAALAAVRELSASGTRHIHALRLALKASERTRNWPEVLRLVRSLDNHNALHPTLSRRMKEMAYSDLLGDNMHDPESVQRVWSTVPAVDRIHPFIAAKAAQAFNACGLHDQARSVVERALATEWDERLMRAYRDSASDEGSPALLAQIERCEEWHAKHPTDHELGLTLGTLCLKQKLWGKAQRHLEQALSDATTPAMVREVHLKLAQLHEALRQHEQAAVHYRLCALATML
jgi:HemY protein